MSSTATATARARSTSRTSAVRSDDRAYFDALSRLPVLRSEEEFKLASALVVSELEIWSLVLSASSIVPGLRRFVQARLGKDSSELDELLAGGPEAERRGEAAAKLRALDQDRLILGELLDEVQRIAEAQPASFLGSSKSVSSAARRIAPRLRELRRAWERTRHRFAEANLRLVVTIARRFQTGQVPLHDLIQEGNLGLLQAIHRFDHRLGFRFSTYAAWWIRHAISRALADKWRTVRVPVHALATARALQRTGQSLSGQLGRPASSDEIGMSKTLDAGQVDQILANLQQQSVSLDRPAGDEGLSLVERLPQHDQHDAPSRLGDLQVLEQVREILGGLNPMQADILRKRFGLVDGEERTLAEIGTEHDLSRERIRQVQLEALEKIRTELRRRNAM
jgi:RNA polymerase primary sigma factor